MGFWESVVLAGGVVASIGLIIRIVIAPVAKGVNKIVDTVQTVEEHGARFAEGEERFERIEADVGELTVAVRPNNGDERSISDRIDTCVDLIQGHVGDDSRHVTTEGA